MTSNELRIVKLSENFCYHELFPRHMCENLSAFYLKGMIDQRILNIAEQIRSDLGSVFVNNWYWGGAMQWRGYRTFDSAYYSSGSAHSWGQALDCNVRGRSPQEVHECILGQQDKYMALGLTRLESLEDAPTWVHLDVKYTGFDHIHVFRA